MAIETRQITGPIATPENELVLSGSLRVRLLAPISDGMTLIAPFNLEYPITDGELPATCKVSVPGTYEFRILDSIEERVWNFQVDICPDAADSISIAALWQLSRLSEVIGCESDPENFDAALLGSNGADSGEVLTANGAGGSEWIPIVGEGLGDMLKVVYDTNDDGKVDAADEADTALSADDADLLGGLTPDSYQPALQDGVVDGSLLVWDVPSGAYIPNASVTADDTGYLHAAGIILSGPVFTSVFVMDRVYYLVADESVVLVTREEAVEVRLPDPAANTGRVIQIKKASADGEVVTISSAGGGTLEGALTYELNFKYEAVTMIAINDAWFIF